MKIKLAKDQLEAKLELIQARIDNKKQHLLEKQLVLEEVNISLM